MGFFLSVSVAITSMPFAALEAASVKLSWNPSPDVTVSGYAIYYGITSHAYTDKISLGNATAVTISNLVEGTTYYFAATAYDKAGIESPFSNEAVYKVPLDASNQPSVLNPALSSDSQFTFTVSGVAGNPYVIETSTNLINWEPVFTNVAPFTFIIPVDSQSGGRFFRADYSAALDPKVSLATLTSAGQTNGQFSFVVSGMAGYPYTVEASTNLVDWVTVTNSVSPFTFTTTDMSQFNQEFFRAVYFP
jgi:Fibronectin type III domain